MTHISKLDVQFVSLKTFYYLVQLRTRTGNYARFAGNCWGLRVSILAEICSNYGVDTRCGRLEAVEVGAARQTKEHDGRHLLSVEALCCRALLH